MKKLCAQSISLNQVNTEVFETENKMIKTEIIYKTQDKLEGQKLKSWSQEGTEKSKRETIKSLK